MSNSAERGAYPRRPRQHGSRGAVLAPQRDDAARAIGRSSGRRWCCCCRHRGGRQHAEEFEGGRGGRRRVGRERGAGGPAPPAFRCRRATAGASLSIKRAGHHHTRALPARHRRRLQPLLRLPQPKKRCARVRCRKRVCLIQQQQVEGAAARRCFCDSLCAHRCAAGCGRHRRQQAGLDVGGAGHRAGRHRAQKLGEAGRLTNARAPILRGGCAAAAAAAAAAATACIAPCGRVSQTRVLGGRCRGGRAQPVHCAAAAGAAYVRGERFRGALTRRPPCPELAEPQRPLRSDSRRQSPAAHPAGAGCPVRLPVCGSGPAACELSHAALRGGEALRLRRTVRQKPPQHRVRRPGTRLLAPARRGRI